MKHSILLILGLAFVFLVSACRQSATPTVSSTQFPSRVDKASVEDKASLVAALQAAGVTVEISDSILQDFFSVEGQTVKLNGTEVQVFEYENAENMEKDAVKVSPDGGSIGTSMVDWIDTPHFYKAGRIIVLYVGSDQAVLDLLNKVLGPQFAGR
jgi:hypothetical protein